MVDPKSRRTPVRVLAGVAIGLAVGGVLVAAVVVTRFGPLVDSPRSWHAGILVALLAVPTIIGAAAGLARRGI